MHWFSSQTAFKGLVLLGALFAFGNAPGAEPIPLAIRGYDPVAYFTDARPVQGLPDFEYAWDGYRYRFASTAHRDQFKTDPVRYAPQFEGLCTMALVEGAKIEADPEYWLINEGKLYLFGSARGKVQFDENTSEAVSRANDNWSTIRADRRD